MSSDDSSPSWTELDRARARRWVLSWSFTDPDLPDAVAKAQTREEAVALIERARGRRRG